jgi:hypothetical protein
VSTLEFVSTAPAFSTKSCRWQHTTIPFRIMFRRLTTNTSRSSLTAGEKGHLHKRDMTKENKHSISRFLLHLMIVESSLEMMQRWQQQVAQQQQQQQQQQQSFVLKKIAIINLNAFWF